MTGSLLAKLPLPWVALRVEPQRDDEPSAAVVLSLNPAFESMVGKDRETMLGRRAETVFSHFGDGRRDLIRTVQTVASTGEQARTTVRLESDDRWYAVTASSPEDEHVLAVFTDITSLKERELALREEEARYRLVVEDQTEFIVRWLPDGSCTFVNEPYCRIFGGTPESNLGSSFPEKLSEDHRNRLNTAVLGFTPGQATFAGDVLLARSGSETVWCHLTTRGHFDDDGRLEELQTVGREVTKRRRAEEELRASEERFRTLFEFAPDAYYLNDLKGTLLDGNRAAEALIGHSRNELVGKSFLKLCLLRARDAPRAAKILARNALGHPTGPDEFELRRRDGSSVHVEIRAYPLSIQGKRVVLGLARDITPRREAEEALRKSEEDLRALVNHATYGIFRLSPDGTFQLVNPALATMLGVPSPDDLLGTRIQDGALPCPEKVQQLLQRLREGERVQDHRIRWTGKDGREVTLRVRGRPVRGSGGKDDRFELMAEDVTERESLQAQLRQAQKMEEIGQLTGGIAHDFNNLLSVILLHTELLHNRLESPDPVVNSAVAGIGEASERAASMTRKLLGFSRQADLQRIPTELGSVVKGLHSMLSRVLPETIEIQVSAEEGGRVVSADPGAIEQMLLNLATNARDAMPDGGVLQVGVIDEPLPDDFWEDRPWAEPGAYVGVFVRDNGMGMDESTRRRIFEPFFTTKSVMEGTGLGMAMVYGLTKQHGGFVDVASEPGEGTTVTLFFPVLEEERSPDVQERHPAHAPVGSETILFVEDEEMLRRVGAGVLEQHGYRVICAADGLEALSILRDGDEPVDLILTDVVMPRMGGAELIDTLKESGNCPRAMYVSGYPGLQREGRRPLDPDIPFLQKPWKMTQLLSRVRQVLDDNP